MVQENSFQDYKTFRNCKVMMKIILDTFPVFSTLNPWDDDIDSSKESKILFIFCPKTYLDINQRRNFSTEEV